MTFSSVSEVYGEDFHVFQRPIEYSIKVAECPAAGQSIFEYAPKNAAAESYRSLAEEVLAPCGGVSQPAVSRKQVEAAVRMYDGSAKVQFQILRIVDGSQQKIRQRSCLCCWSNCKTNMIIS